MKNKIIKEIEITKKTKIIISTVQLADKEKLDIRLWYFGFNKKTNSKVEEWLPSYKGINTLINKCPEIIKALQDVPIPVPDSCEEDLE